MLDSESFLLNMSFDLLIQWCNVSICSNGYEFRFFNMQKSTRVEVQTKMASDQTVQDKSDL